MANDREAYWRPRAERLLIEANYEFFYGVDSTEVMQLGEEYGFDELTRNLRIQAHMQELYWRDEPGDRDAATQIYLERDDEFPEWFWRYHGVYA